MINKVSVPEDLLVMLLQDFVFCGQEHSIPDNEIREVLKGYVESAGVEPDQIEQFLDWAFKGGENETN